MLNRTKWILRPFMAIDDNGVFPCILERLDGTPARLCEKISKIPATILNKSYPAKWSIKREIGHLTDLEPLWMERICQIASSAALMIAADMTNEKTDTMNHDDKEIEELLAGFKQARGQTMEYFNSLNVGDLLKFSFHPRLMKPMRIIDLAYFIAEHDDHHLAQITCLAKMPN